ncbi:hypothetical protein [Streptomyces sp. NPDC052042]|uniref:hypothetical protein n=1 Tax=Streptomyces sp. NPDC052042 TaxID=3365683 RepID=UPI0037D97FF9
MTGPLSFFAVTGPASGVSSAGEASSATAALAKYGVWPATMTPRPNRFAVSRTMPANTPSPSGLGGLGRRWRALTHPPPKRRPA